MKELFSLVQMGFESCILQGSSKLYLAIFLDFDLTNEKKYTGNHS